jgi:hypothetical protein
MEGFTHHGIWKSDEVNWQIQDHEILKSGDPDCPISGFHDLGFANLLRPISKFPFSQSCTVSQVPVLFDI